MVEFTHVLCPTDLSEASVRPLTYAAALARWYEATLTVLHVVPTFEPMTVRPATLGGSAHVVQPLAREEVLDGLRRVVEQAGAGSNELTLAAEEGDAARVIVDRTLAVGADLVVMGTHGRSGFQRFFVGSVAERVLGHAPCPVLMVPPHVTAALPAEVRFARVVCPVDFSPSSLLALGFALDLARQADGAVTVVHAVEWLTEEEPAVHTRFDVDAYRRHLVDAARARLQALVADESRTWSAIDHAIVFGRPHREILRVAGETSADLIVMGAQGRGGLGLALFGSTTQQIVRAAPCPVLVVRAPEAVRP